MQVEGRKNIYYTKINQYKARVAELCQKKIDFKAIPLEILLIMTKGSIQQEDITILNLYTPNNVVSLRYKARPIRTKWKSKSTISNKWEKQIRKSLDRDLTK